jgi:hypothetical protein
VRRFLRRFGFSLWSAAVLCSAALVWPVFPFSVKPAASGMETTEGNQKEKPKRRSKAPPHSREKNRRNQLVGTGHGSGQTLEIITTSTASATLP